MLKSRAHFVLVCLAAGLIVSGCAAPSSATATPGSPAGSPSAPTVLPQVSTAIAATGTALARASSLATAAALATLTAPPAALPAATSTVPAGLSTVAPADTPAVPPTPFPTRVIPTLIPGQPRVPEAILLITPGNGSVALPFVRVSGEADPTFEQNLVVEISDAGGKVLATQPTTIQGAGATRGPFDVSVLFTVTTQVPGRISVFSTSARDGGLIHLSSVDVTLMPGGTAEPFAGPVHDEIHIILQPAPQAQVSGGSLHVSGFSDYVFESQLSLALCGAGGAGAPDEVCGTAGNVLATGTARLSALDVGQPGPFAGDLAYHVSAPVSARLAVYSRSARDGGIVHLTSVPVQLAP